MTRSALSHGFHLEDAGVCPVPDSTGPMGALERLWLGLTFTRRECYRLGILRGFSLGVPVIGVSALAWGGAGKTPVALFLAERLAQLGHRPAVVCHGYRGTLGGVPSLVSAAGQGARLGDEPVMLARRGLLVARGANRVEAAGLAVAAGADVVVADGGWGHLRLARDLDILLVDGRTSPRSIALASRSSAQLLLWHHLRYPAPCGSPAVRLNVPAAVSSCFRAVTLVELSSGRRVGVEWLRGRRVRLVAGIARPAAFAHTVRGLGALIVERRWLRDHQRIFLSDLGPSESGVPVVISEKDWARLDRPSPGVWALLGDTELGGGHEVLDERLRGLRCSVG